MPNRAHLALSAGTLVALALLGGCASVYPVGIIYTEVKVPVDATANGSGTKVGTSKCTSILSWVATGDASIEAAKKNGGITKVTAVDWHARNILGVYGEYTCTVYGD